AAIAAPRSEMFRRPSARACGCVPAHWVVTVHRVARQDGSANRASDSQGPLVPVTPGRAVPANSFLILGRFGPNYSLEALHACQIPIPVIPTAGSARGICFFLRFAEKQ